MIEMLPNPTLDQLQVFIAVAETGSFSAAARRLNRAQSVVSYTIANLEAQLELVLIDRSNPRVPALTEAGRAILGDARRMIVDLDALRARSVALNRGLEGEVRIAVSVMVPDHILLDALQAFQKQFPTVQLILTVGAPFVVSHMARAGEIDVGIGADGDTSADDKLVARRLGASYMLPFAAPGHPLAVAGRRLSAADVRDEVQIVVSDATGITRGRDFNVFSRRTWRVSDMNAKRQLLIAGLGWGGMPVSLVAEDVMAGRLVRLDVEPFAANDFPVNAVWPAASPPGPAAMWLMECFTSRLGQCPSSLSDLLAHMDGWTAKQAGGGTVASGEQERPRLIAGG